MTYKKLKNLLLDNMANIIDFDLAGISVKSKIILCVGKRADTVSAYLSSIMSECGISFSRYTNDEKLELRNRFARLGSPVDDWELCRSADIICKSTSSALASEVLLVLMALSLLDGAEYLLIDLSYDLYEHIFERINPFAVIFTDGNDDKNEFLAQSVPSGAKEIVIFSEKEDFDYISRHTNTFVARINYASSNKATVFRKSPLGTEFFYFDKPYRISSRDESLVNSANIALTAARALFSPTSDELFLGIDNTVLSKDKDNLFIG